MATMLAAQKTTAAPGLELREISVPRPGPNELLVKVRAASICGTDVHIYHWDAPWNNGRIAPPRTMGHEVCGEVAEVGSGVTKFQKGDLVSAESHIYCGACGRCRKGNGHICEKLKFFGVEADGFWADFAIIPEQNAWKNPPDMPPEMAKMLFEETRRAVLRGESLEEFLSRLTGGGLPGRKRRKGRRR